ncbi:MULTISPECIES: phage tail protein [Streptomyces]|jgi:phage tail-like protein|uniref:Phage tail protein n=2 Tax=Streptomyces TaxID=1883 RepID=A0A514JTN6_9ACTN|nr:MULTISPECIES: phage tail protein [Streptomyces]MBA8943523.1 phage tail-like protein [Streptomyces calvus]MBA8977149.1 phage tail-like protein [Streptomyces calvus]MYS30205.1 phage tail protein [Streptomyces sp. SID7804]QDI70018.1 phage tail protein [Streptomyces calvus]GGP39364.1 phage tail protein [Streptomyces calvus]
MATGDALSTHIFGVQLGGYLVESIQEISGLTVEEDVVEVKQVTAEGKRIIRKQPGGRQAGEITITRGLDQSSEFTNWIKETLNNGAVNTARQNLTIEIKDTEGNTVRRIQLMQGWASKWEGPSLQAGESSAATETVTIVFEEIVVE